MKTKSILPIVILGILLVALGVLLVVSKGNLAGLLSKLTGKVTEEAAKATDSGIQELKPIGTPEKVSESIRFRDEFDTDITKDWGIKVISGLEKQLIWSQEDSHFRAEILNGNDTNFIFLHKDKNYKDVVVQAEIQNLGQSDNYMSVICRASEKGWYEFRVTSRGYYEVLKFDQYLKNQGKNPYVNLSREYLRTPLIKTGQEKNLIALSCTGNLLKVYINNEQLFQHRRPLEIEDNTFQEGTIGFGVASHGKSADLSFNWVEALNA